MSVIKYVSQSTLDPAYNEHLVITSKFLCIKIIDCNVKKFSYNKHPLLTSSFFCIFFTRCKRDPMYKVLRVLYWKSNCL